MSRRDKVEYAQKQIYISESGLTEYEKQQEIYRTACKKNGYFLKKRQYPAFFGNDHYPCTVKGHPLYMNAVKPHQKIMSTLVQQTGDKSAQSRSVP